MNSAERTFELLTQLVNSKKNLSDTLVSKGEEASVNEPFDDLVQKAADYIPKSYIFVDENGNEIAGVLVSQETVFDATENDVREGKTFASEVGVKTGTKFIPSYNTVSGKRKIASGQSLVIPLYDTLILSDYTELQVIICEYNNTVAESVAAINVVIDNKVYTVGETNVVAEVLKDTENNKINLGITNESENACLIRYLLYKEII